MADHERKGRWERRRKELRHEREFTYSQMLQGSLKMGREDPCEDCRIHFKRRQFRGSHLGRREQDFQKKPGVPKAFDVLRNYLKTLLPFGSRKPSVGLRCNQRGGKMGIQLNRYSKNDPIQLSKKTSNGKNLRTRIGSWNFPPRCND